MYLLNIDFVSIGIKLFQFILSLSILVIIHELGHFLAAKMFKCRVEKFYLFFNPWFSLYTKKIKETVFGIGWIPLGGYVKIAGMMDESMDKKSLQQKPQPWEYRSKKAWQRLIIILSGIIFNLVLALFIYIFIAFVWGESYISTENLKYGIHASAIGKKMGIQDEDIIIKVGAEKVENPSKILSFLILNEATNITVIRDGKEVELLFPVDIIAEINEYLSQRNDPSALFPFCYPTIIEQTTKDAHILEGDLLPGDQIITINNKSTPYFFDLQKLRLQLKNQDVSIQVLRKMDTAMLKAHINSDGVIGFLAKNPTEILGYKMIKYSFFESIGKGAWICVNTVTSYLKSIYMLFASEHIKVKDSVGSVITIANIFPNTFDWQAFWSLTGFISIMLAIVNLLPIPALDGGHALFILIEIISGKKPNQKVLEYAQVAGMVLLLLLMVYSLGLDFRRFFF